jgi:hypothetical protein
MRVFKHLVAMADIAVGFLGLFFIIFAVARPNSAADFSQLQELDRLKQKLHELETLQLAPSKSGKSLPKEERASITLSVDGIRIRIRGAEAVSATHENFRAVAAKIKWPAEVIYYIDRRITFEKVVSVIDVLKQLQPNITVRIAALAQ